MLAAVKAPPRTLSPFRLRRHADYQRVYQASRKYFSASMAYFFRLRTPDEPLSAGPRIGLTVGRVMGKAVDRNRIKRRMREAARLHLHLLQAQSSLPVDLVLHPRKSVATMDFATLERELAKIFVQVAALASRPEPPNADAGSRRAPGSRSRNKSGLSSVKPDRPARARDLGDRTRQRSGTHPEQTRQAVL